jgi:hypothetical protein
MKTGTVKKRRRFYEHGMKLVNDAKGGLLPDSHKTLSRSNNFSLGY